MRAPEVAPFRWSMVVESLTQPYPVSIPMMALVTMVPFYVFIPLVAAGRTLHVPELALDRLVPLKPAWALVYGALYLFLIVLPVFVVRQGDHVLAGILLATVAYGVFLRNRPRDQVPEVDRKLAPVFGLCSIGVVGFGVACFWVAYQLKGLS